MTSIMAAVAARDSPGQGGAVGGPEGHVRCPGQIDTSVAGRAMPQQVLAVVYGRSRQQMPHPSDGISAAGVDHHDLSRLWPLIGTEATAPRSSGGIPTDIITTLTQRSGSPKPVGYATGAIGRLP